jgi:hypothetical protein
MNSLFALEAAMRFGDLRLGGDGLEANKLWRVEHKFWAAPQWMNIGRILHGLGGVAAERHMGKPRTSSNSTISKSVSRSSYRANEFPEYFTIFVKNIRKCYLKISGISMKIWSASNRGSLIAWARNPST